MQADNDLSQTFIRQKVQQLQGVFQTGLTRPYEWRLTQLRQLHKMLTEHQVDLLKALHLDLAKSTSEAWTAEIGYVISDIRHTIKHLKSWMKARKVSTPLVAQPGKSYQLPEPLGCVLIIGAWNYPLQLVLCPLVAAIAAGNCAVLKPSELASHSSALLAKLLPQYLSTQAFWVQQGEVKETTDLLRQRFDHIFYTGGEAVGKIVMRAAADYLTPVTLELGGKSPCIIDNTAKLEVAVTRLVWSKWMNAGQTCVAPDYVLIEKSQTETFLRLVKQQLEGFYGKSVKTSKDYGRVINQRHLTRLLGYLQGQHIVYGGESDLAQNYLSPTVVLDPAPDSPLMQEEIFGPILAVLSVEHIEQAIEFINQRPKPLALYVFTRNQLFEQQVLNETSAGNVCINDGMMFMTNPNLPFGGVGSSGMGSYHGQAGFDTFSHLKSVMKRSNWPDPSLRYPPYNKLKLALLKKLL